MLGEKVRALRKKAGLTLDELAAQIGASRSSLWELENKDKGRPSADRIYALARALAVTPEFLLDDGRNEPNASDVQEAFFRRYQGLDKNTQEQLAAILEVLDQNAKAAK